MATFLTRQRPIPVMGMTGIAMLWLAFLATPVYAAGPAAPVGAVEFVSGRATVLQRASVADLTLNTPMYVGARLYTGRTARVRLHMLDGARILLGANTQFVIDDYQYDRVADSGRASLNLVRGFIRAITGRITKRDNAPFSLRTAMLTIGVRGTDFWGEQTPELAQVALISGRRIVVSTRAGQVEITTPFYGTRVTSADRPPEPPYRWSEEALRRAMGTVDEGVSP